MYKILIIYVKNFIYIVDNNIEKEGAQSISLSYTFSRNSSVWYCVICFWQQILNWIT